LKNIVYINVLKERAVSLIGWWKLDGNSIDSSQSFNNGTDTGISYSTTITKTGQSATFTGTGSSYIDLDSNIPITTHHSVTFWMYGGTQNPGGPTDSMLLGTGQVATDYMYAADNLRFRVNPGEARDWTSDTDFYNRWRHVVLLFGASTIELFLDGVSQGTNAYDGTYNIDNMGAPYNNNNYDFNGNLNDVRIYDHLLGLKEIQELANAKVLHWQFTHERNNSGDTISDSSGYGRHTTLDGNSPTWSKDTVKGVGCYDQAFFAGKYIEISSSDFPVVFTDQITVSLWVNFDTFAAWNTLVHGSITADETNSYWLATSSSSNMRWSINNDTANDFDPGMSTGAWYHICATYDGSNCNVYINGVEKAGNFAQSGNISNQNGLKIGLAGDGQDDFRGRLTDIRIYNKALTQTEAIALYQTAAQLDNKGNLWC
jgi:hypothetical protein